MLMPPRLRRFINLRRWVAPVYTALRSLIDAVRGGVRMSCPEVSPGSKRGAAQAGEFSRAVAPVFPADVASAQVARPARPPTRHRVLGSRPDYALPRSGRRCAP